ITPADVITEVDEPIVLSRRDLAAIAATFLLIGMVASAYGPLLMLLANRFEVSLPIAGGVLSSHFAGALVGVLASIWAMERLQNRHLVVAALAFLALGCVLVALAPAWPVLLGAIFFVGVGFGALDIGLNQIVAHSHGGRRAVVLTMLNGSFGLGAVLGPILVSILGRHHFALLYAGGAVLAVALIPRGLRIPGHMPAVSSPHTSRPPWLIPIFILAFGLYVGTETGVGGWSTSHLEFVGLAPATAAAFTSAFWLALAIGRLLVGLVPARVPEPVIVITASVLGALALLAAAFGRPAPIAYVATGLAIAPIFPTAVVWMARRLPGDARATSWLFPGAMVGGALVPAVIGLVIARIGLGGAPVVLSAAAFGTFVTFLVARRVSSAPPIP
ncbi:MAG: MFS transporter, partial [Candidatus Dormibacteraceae bacterium]